ncbi:MAG: hypothetical protein WB510_17305, partial [Candidatus Sulfotelmatobacter sp.]
MELFLAQRYRQEPYVPVGSVRALDPKPNSLPPGYNDGLSTLQYPDRLRVTGKVVDRDWRRVFANDTLHKTVSICGRTLRRVVHTSNSVHGD